MKEGKSPIGTDGYPIELHHITQKEPDTMAEVLRSKHKRHYDVLHSSHKDYKSWRKTDYGKQKSNQYSSFRKKYWMDRYNNLE